MVHYKKELSYVPKLHIFLIFGGGKVLEDKKFEKFFLQRGCQLITLGRSAGERAVCSPKEQCNRLTRPLKVYFNA